MYHLKWMVNCSLHYDFTLINNNKMLSCDANYHLLKVDINGVVQDALTVCFIHHDQSVHLKKEDLT